MMKTLPLILLALLFVFPALAQSTETTCTDNQDIYYGTHVRCMLEYEGPENKSKYCRCLIASDAPKASEAKTCTDNQDIYYGTHKRCLDEYKGSEDLSKYCSCLNPPEPSKASEPKEPEQCKAICVYDDVDECQEMGHSYKYCECIDYAENDHCQASN